MRDFFATMTFLCIVLFALLTCSFIFIPATAAVGNGTLGILYLPIVGGAAGFAFAAHNSP